MLLIEGLKRIFEFATLNFKHLYKFINALNN